MKNSWYGVCNWILSLHRQQLALRKCEVSNHNFGLEDLALASDESSLNTLRTERYTYESNLIESNFPN